MEEEKKYYAYQILDINDLEGEIWKDIEGYEGLYQISNLGRVKSMNYHNSGKPRIMKQKINRGGYLCLTISINGVNYYPSVHRLVAISFIPNPNNYPCVNHIKEFEKLDNSVKNLEFCTIYYNNNYGTRIERAATTMRGRKLSAEHAAKAIKAGKERSIPIVQLDENNIGRKWSSAHEAKREGGFDNRHIGKCCKGEYKQHKGYKWDYFTPPAVII